jgi:8-oxo-dGTP diphosphatase
MTAHIDKLALFSILDKKLLVVRSKGKSLFYLPGGKRELNETDHEALIREISEELATNLISSTITYATTLEAQADGKPEGTLVKLSCYFADYDETPTPAAEIEELRYVDSNDIEICSKAAILCVDWLKANGYIN